MENSKEKCGCKNCCCGSNCECNEVSELATGPIMYEGKAKQLFPTANDDELLVHYKDDAIPILIHYFAFVAHGRTSCVRVCCLYGYNAIGFVCPTGRQQTTNGSI